MGDNARKHELPARDHLGGAMRLVTRFVGHRERRQDGPAGHQISRNRYSKLTTATIGLLVCPKWGGAGRLSPWRKPLCSTVCCRSPERRESWRGSPSLPRPTGAIQNPRARPPPTLQARIGEPSTLATGCQASCGYSGGLLGHLGQSSSGIAQQPVQEFGQFPGLLGVNGRQVVLLTQVVG